MKLLTLFLIVAVTFGFVDVIADTTVCDDWEVYGNELCVKVMDNVGLLSFNDAEKTCSLNKAKLVAINDKVKHEFLKNFLFVRSKVVDNVWLGAKFANGKYHWEDGSNVTYVDWAPGNPKNLPDYCVQMSADVKLVGKWADEPCTQSNRVVCERGQSWSLEHFQKEFLKATGRLQRELEATKAQLAETNKRLVQTQQQLNHIQPQQALTVPVGFTYVQLPKEKSPQEIWPHLQWTDVTANYAGLFFRAEGSGSAAFGTVQHENFQRISKIDYLWTKNDGFMQSIAPAPGHWTLKTGVFKHGICDKDHQTGFNITISGGELRPKNMAMRIWKRSG